MEKTLTFKEFQVFIQQVLATQKEITIQQIGSSSHSPKFTFNLKVERCVPIYNGIQFHVPGGYINLEFEDRFTIENGFIEEQLLHLCFKYDDDKPRGYWLHFEGIMVLCQENRHIKWRNILTPTTALRLVAS